MSHSGLIFSNSPVTRIDDGAGRFILSMVDILGIFYPYWEVSILDIKGGIASSQWGMVWFASQDLLQWGIDAYLEGKGYRAQRTPLQRLRLLASVVGEDQELYQEARSLVLANPTTPDETKEYARRCIAFTEERLGMGRLKDWGSMESQAEWVRLCTNAYRFMKVLEGINEASMIQPTAAMERQWELRGKLVPDAGELIVD